MAPRPEACSALRFRVGKLSSACVGPRGPPRAVRSTAKTARGGWHRGSRGGPCGGIQHPRCWRPQPQKRWAPKCIMCLMFDVYVCHICFCTATSDENLRRLVSTSTEVCARSKGAHLRGCIVCEKQEKLALPPQSTSISRALLGFWLGYVPSHTRWAGEGAGGARGAGRRGWRWRGAGMNLAPGWVRCAPTSSSSSLTLIPRSQVRDETQHLARKPLGPG